MDDGRRTVRPLMRGSPGSPVLRPAANPRPPAPAARLTFPVIPEFLKKTKETPADGGKENE